MTREIHIGISTCPNDTFAFHALLNNRIDTGNLTFRFELLDVEELNQRLSAGEFDVAKGSFHAGLLLSDQLALLSSGSALGFGVGPLLLSATRDSKPSDGFADDQGGPRQPEVGCPGKHTTATMLYQLFFPGQGNLRQMVFSEIMPKLKTKELDFGVCIHEGRFTFAEQGLDCVCDLGTLWEQQTDLPLPLGGIFVRKSLGQAACTEIQSVVRRSLDYGLTHREETLESMRRYAQEFSDEVLFSHVDTYVNDWTLELGTLGDQALKELARRLETARHESVTPLEVIE